MKYKLLLLSVILSFFSYALKAQLSKEDYQNADSVAKFSRMIYQSAASVTWIDSSYLAWYTTNTKSGLEYKIVDAKKLEIEEAFDQEKLCKAINQNFDKQYKPYHLGLRSVEFKDKGRTLSFELERSRWQIDLRNYRMEKLPELKRERRERYWAASEDINASRKTHSPDGKWEAQIREHNVFIRDIEADVLFQLSFDGSPGDYYASRLSWSPDSKKLVANKIRKHEKRYMYFVDSSPENQLQPVLEKREYLKPGDALPIKRPCLFDVDSKKQIHLETGQFENQYQLGSANWRPDSRAFTFEFNQRGHQLYQVVEVDAGSGDLKVLIEEKSETFIDYSGKHFRHDLSGSDEIIWASERSGWNHLYLIDASTGEVKNQITTGDWPVRGVEHVNEKERSIIFRASGRNEKEDPYFIHYYKINLDGTGLLELTPEQRHHKAVFSADHRFFTDTYSTVNVPPVTVLRSTEDAKVLCVIEEADISDLLQQNWHAPEVFVAKGRDGNTDIWGNIYFPTHFDSTKRYPVIEYIYAGPHGSFTQKSFRPYSRSISALAELGFIIVQMDGMGTSHRSKAFQDVCYQNLKDAGFPDRILWMKAAAETRPYMDLSRVGIFGTSAGGQSALAALFFHPEFYKAGVASCGCHDNRMDKMWWNEQWMGYPIGKHYEDCSNVVNAHKLQGELMLIVGELDDNVDPASTMQVADALIKANKDFELVVIPGANHTSGGKFGERKRRDFFVSCLLGENSPDWNMRPTD